METDFVDIVLQFTEGDDGGDECRVCGRSEVEHEARTWVKKQVQQMTVTPLLSKP